MKTDVLENAKRLTAVSEMADNALLGGTIDKEECTKIKKKARGLELDNLFRAMADYCNS